MVANVNIDSAAVSLLAAYNKSQAQMMQVQNAVSTTYDINKASDDPLLYSASQNLRNQANSYAPVITKITQYKSSFDRLQANLQNVSSLASKVRDTINSLTSGSSGNDIVIAAASIKQYLISLQNVIANSLDSSTNIGLNTNAKVMFDISPNSKISLTQVNAYSAGTTMTYVNKYMDIASILQTSSSAFNIKTGTPTYGLVQINWGTTVRTADLATATHRADFLTSVNNFINTTIAAAATNAGAFSNALDAQLQAMQTSRDSLNSEADAITKTDLTKDSAQSAALSTQQQLLTSLLSMSNQRMQTVLGLFR